ncbi:hypothetical protein [Brevibacillus porteri]|uniref:hypothetical protein n=2 Tax=Brevibacillus porteri TaxID=2126350 RepID=UPI00370A63BB
MSRTKTRANRRALRDQVIGCVFLMGVTFSLWGSPATTYSWMWEEAKDPGHEFAVGLLDISDSRFADEWQVVSGGNQAVDLSRMIPGDSRKIKATLSNGASDLDFIYKIVAKVKDAGVPGSAQKLEEVLRIKIEQDKDVIYEGLVRELHQGTPGIIRSNSTEEVMHADEADKTFFLTIYLPAEGVDHSFQSLSAQLELRFLAKQATADSIFAE